ncbi:MAG: hypothetical protein KDB37_12795 [Ilumatobacter sp.]|nr:hypothetical protein [Ilumatobacter sp.]
MKLIVVLVSGSLVLASCGRDDATSDAVPEAEHRLAVMLCANLRDKTNALVDVVNDSVVNIHDLDEIERADNIRAGYVAARAVLDEWEQSLDTLELPDDVPEAEALRDELLASVDAGRAELADEEPAFENALASIPDDEVRGAVGIWQNTIEKVMSVTEPRIEAYDRIDLQRAFLDEPSCRHVVQPFRLDD